MKAGLFISFSMALAIFSGCNSGNNDANVKPEVVVEDTVFESPLIDEDSVLFVENKSMLWHVDDTKGFKLQKPAVPGIDSMSAKKLIEVLNKNSDSIYLDYIKTSHDTIYVQIPRSEMLTERIGSTGAEMYMASATWSLTELKGIKYVNYYFEEGDHASPGVYKRDDFKKFQ